MSNEFQIGITSGIISSILATAIVGFVVLIWRGIIMPRLREMLYSGLDVSGTWYGQGDRTESKKYAKYEASINLDQSADAITGELVVKNITSENEASYSHYQVEGFIRNDNVVLNYFRKTKKETGVGAIVLKVISAGKGMKGNIVFIDSWNQKVKTLVDAVFERNKIIKLQ